MSFIPGVVLAKGGATPKVCAVGMVQVSLTPATLWRI